MTSTQDEIYYLFDAAPDACMCFGLTTEVDTEAMISNLQPARGWRFGIM